MADQPAATSDDIDRVVRRQNREYFSSRQPIDDVLQLVALLGRTGPAVAVSMVVDGMIITGVIGPTQGFLDALRDATSDALGPGFLDDEKSTETVLSFYDRAAETADARNKSDAEVADLYLDTESIDEIPVDHTTEYYRVLRDHPFVELHDVSIRSGASEPIETKHARIRADRISAWWPVKAEGIDVNYVWQSSDPDPETNNDA